MVLLLLLYSGLLSFPFPWVCGKKSKTMEARGKVNKGIHFFSRGNPGMGTGPVVVRDVGPCMGSHLVFASVCVVQAMIY